MRPLAPGKCTHALKIAAIMLTSCTIIFILADARRIDPDDEFLAAKRVCEMIAVCYLFNGYIHIRVGLEREEIRK
jgi:hypothetical protein